MRPKAQPPIGRGSEPCLTCKEEDCPLDCQAFTDWEASKTITMEEYHLRWDEDVYYNAMRRTWGSTLEVYLLIATEGPYAGTKPIDVLRLIYHLHQEVIP